MRELQIVTTADAKELRELIQSDTYERIVLDIMNMSKLIFPSEYGYNARQDKGQSDFFDKKTGEKFDAKILFKQKQCILISKGADSFLEWIKSVLKDSMEVTEKIRNKQLRDIKETPLYCTFAERMEKIEGDENAVLFIPFPIRLHIGEGIYSQFAEDILSMVYDAWIEKNSEQKNKGVYVIYPQLDNEIMIRELTNGSCRRERVKTDVLSKYILHTQNKG